MTKKFIRTLKDEVKDVARDINNNTVMAYDIKKKDIEDEYIPKKLLTVLTPEEVKRAERAGLFVGFVIIVAIVFCIIWFFWGHFFQ